MTRTSAADDNRAATQQEHVVVRNNCRHVRPGVLKIEVWVRTV